MFVLIERVCEEDIDLKQWVLSGTGLSGQAWTEEVAASLNLPKMKTELLNGIYKMLLILKFHSLIQLVLLHIGHVCNEIHINIMLQKNGVLNGFKIFYRGI